MNDLATLLVEVRELRAIVERGVPPLLEARTREEMAARARGLLSYEDLRDRLTIGVKHPHRPSLRTVKGIVAKHRAIVRPVPLGHSLVGFRPASVEKLISHLSGETPDLTQL
jgi:hypothetical protein